MVHAMTGCQARKVPKDKAERIFDRPDGLRFLPLLSPGVRRTLEASDGTATLFESIPAQRLTPREQGKLAREIRTWNAAEVTGLPGAMAPACAIPGRSRTRRELADHCAGRDSCSGRPQASVTSRSSPKVHMYRAACGGSDRVSHGPPV